MFNNIPFANHYKSFVTCFETKLRYSRTITLILAFEFKANELKLYNKTSIFLTGYLLAYVNIS